MRCIMQGRMNLDRRSLVEMTRGDSRYAVGGFVGSRMGAMLIKCLDGEMLMCGCCGNSAVWLGESVVLCRNKKARSNL